MHVVFISSENPFCMNNGGIGAYCRYIIEMMAYNGNKVSFVTISNDEKNKYIRYMPNNSVVNIYQLFYKQSSDCFPMDLMELFYNKVKNIHESDPIDVIECQDWLGIGCKIVENMDIPFITRLHTPLFLVEKIANNQKIYRFSKQIKECEKIQMLKSTALSSPCTSLSDIIYEEIGVKAQIIPNPIDTKVAYYGMTYPRPKTVKSKKYFLYLGRLEYRKGVLVLAEALCQILKNHTDYMVVLCGKDTVYKKQSVKSLIKAKCAQFENSICFIENVIGDEKMAYINNAELIIQPSLWENFSYVTLECMASGKPIVCTKSGGFIEMLQDGVSGFLAEPYSANSLAKKIDEALNSDLKKIGEYARKKVTEYDVKVLKDEFQCLYTSVIRMKKSC